MWATTTQNAFSFTSSVRKQPSPLAANFLAEVIKQEKLYADKVYLLNYRN